MVVMMVYCCYYYYPPQKKKKKKLKEKRMSFYYVTSLQKWLSVFRLKTTLPSTYETSIDENVLKCRSDIH